MKNILNKNKNIKLVFTAIILIITAILTTISLSATTVTLSFTPAPNIDVVLAKSKTNTEITTFDNDLINALNNIEVDTEKVKISSVSTETVNIQNAFSWNKDLNGSIGQITIENNGQNVQMIGNSSLPGKNAIYIIPENKSEQKFNFSYNINYGDSFNAAGMLLKIEKNNNQLTGYMLSFNKSGQKYYNTSGGKLGAIWKFNWTIGTNTASMSCLSNTSTLTNNSCVLVKALDIQVTGNLTVKVDDNYIQIDGGGLSTTEKIAIENTYKGLGFGFFSDHYSHNCSSIGNFALTGINLEKTTVKNFSEVLREPEFRNDAIKVVVNINDYENEELQSNSTMGELLTRLVNEELKFVAWGKSNANKQQYENLINANNGDGIYIENTNYSTSITKTAEYIKTLINQLKGNNNYLILGEPIKITANPSNILNNTANPSYPYGKWQITHNYKYFENNVGQFDKANQYLNNMITEFDKTGQYTITYEDKSIIPQNIYVHRRPIAIINHNRNNLNISLSSASYDLDTYSQANNGIIQEEWKYRKATDTTWTTGKLTTLEANNDYIIQLKVKDNQGAWSIPASVYTTNDSSALPIASFKIENDKISKYETLTINDTSYDPYGGSITNRIWEVYKGETKVYSGSTAKLSGYKDIGVYVMKLKVTNDRGLTSEVYSRTFQLTDDTTAPSILVTPENCEWSKQTNINVSFSDSQSGFKSYKYAITNNQTEITQEQWSNEITNAHDTITINTQGKNYLHIKATDNAGNESNERITGIYKIDRTAPTINLVYDTNTNHTNSITINATATDEESGIKNFKIDEQNITGNKITFIKNGTYTFTAEDNVGWTTTKKITINNIYYECNKELEHPKYNSSYSYCPICESYKGITITKNTNTYDAKEHNVQYTNPNNANIIEYYNGNKTQLPTKVGNYTYELKAIYQGNEYKTGITGNYTITPKNINITNVKALNKTYDGNNKITLTNGTLVGICNNDDVNFKLPSIAYSENKNVGVQKIKLENNITLTGTDAYNYNLIQPTYGTITANIEKRNITISGVQGKTKKYDTSNKMEIIGGTIINGIQGDDISLVIPTTGISESAEVGNWKIKIDDIILKGTDSKNYNLQQPQEVRGSIVKELSILEIDCNDKIYNQQPAKPYIIKNNTSSKVTFTFYEAGTNNKIQSPVNVGKYEVVASIISDGNHIETTTQRKKFEILAKEISITNINIQNKIYDGTNEFSVSGGELVGVYKGDNVECVLPKIGYSNEKNVGNYNIKLDTIKLTGKQAKNYTLIQPKYESLTANITPKLLYVKNINIPNKTYNQNNIVPILGADLEGIVKNDKVQIQVPQIGYAENIQPGTWPVKIDNITIQGQDANNYKIQQPEKLYVTIQKANGKLEFNCLNKKYDGKPVKPYITENNSGGNVTLRYFIAGTNIQVEQPTKVGKYELIAFLDETNNYNAYISKRLPVEITNPDAPNLKVKSTILSINGINTQNNTKAQYLDTITIKINITNTEIGNGYLKKISTILPKELELVENSQINKKYEWVQNKEKLETTIYSYEKNKQNIVLANEQNNIELQLELKVIQNTKKEIQISIPFEIEQQNILGNKIEYSQEQKQNSKTNTNIQYTFSDISIQNNIKEIKLINKTSKKEEKIKLNTQNKIIKIELPKEKFATSIVEAKYEITLKNESNNEATVEKITNILPNSTTFETKNNSNWQINKTGNLIYNKLIQLQPNETKTVELTLRWQLNENDIKVKTNQTYITAQKEIDNQLIQQNKVKLANTNNYDKTELLVCINTGKANVYTVVILISIIILIIAIVIIKKIVL